VGGAEVANGKYPFIATLQDIRRGGTGYERHICGGTLIAPGYVLTAAHCVFDYDKNNRPTTLTLADQWQTIAGRMVLDNDQGQERTVTSVSVHPRYKKNHT
jgi:secreted trypsin-like serine protease